MDHPYYAASDEALLQHCDIERMRSSGPGGQHAQKNATAVRLQLTDEGLMVHCQDFRSFADNQKRALKQLRLQLALQERGYARPEWLSAHLQQGRIRCGPDATSWPCLVARLLDILTDNDYDMQAAAAQAGCSASQITKCLARHKTVWQFLQQERQQRGLSRLRHSV